MREAKSIREFKMLMKKENIGVVFRQNEAGRIYGVTFIDYPNRAVLNGSRLGKEFSANVFNDLFSNNQSPVEIQKHTENHSQNTNSDLSLGSVLGLLDMPQSNNDYEEENFIHEHKKKKVQKKKGRGI